MYQTLFSYVDDVALLIVVLLPTITAVVIALEGLARVIRSGGNVYAALRDVGLAGRKLVDQTSDPLVLAIAAKTGKAPELIVKQATGLIDQIVNLLPEEAPHA